MTKTTNLGALNAASDEIFGNLPEDVISPIKSAYEALYQLAEIFRSIAKEAGTDGCPVRTKRLADAGAYLADDIANYCDDQHGTMYSRILELGFVHDRSAKADQVKQEK